MSTSSRLLVGGALVVITAIVAGLLLVIRPWGSDETHLTVDFDRTVSLYEGADVRILGVRVGTVDSVEPMGEKVRVELSWDSDYKVPADAKAVIVSPAIVGDRYVQLTPAYQGGAELEDDAVLDASRTAVPVELDQVYDSLDQLATALGPEGANKNGSLDRLLSSSAKALDGQGKKFHRTLKDLSKLTGTLDDNKDELFGSTRQLERFVKALADNDIAVREFNSSLSEVSQMLAGEREDLAGALRALGSSLDKVRTYVRDNRAALKSNVDALVDVTDQLVGQRKNLAKIMNTAPTTLANQVLAYNPSMGSIDNRTTVTPATAQALGFYGFTKQIVGPTSPQWAGLQYAYCASLSKRGGTGIFTEPVPRRCNNSFSNKFFVFLATRGLPKGNRTAAAGDLGKLERTDDSSGLASLMAVNP